MGKGICSARKLSFVPSLLQVVDNLDGTYQGVYLATQSGAYEVSVMLLQEGGLTAYYFENIWFFYTPVLTVVDPQINHNWGTGLITPTASEYISIRWLGSLKPQYSETFTFYVTSDDGSRLWVDNVITQTVNITIYHALQSSTQNI